MQGQGPYNINLSLFVSFFDVYWPSLQFPSINYGGIYPIRVFNLARPTPSSETNSSSNSFPSFLFSFSRLFPSVCYFQ